MSGTALTSLLGVAGEWARSSEAENWGGKRLGVALSGLDKLLRRSPPSSLYLVSQQEIENSTFAFVNRTGRWRR